MNSVKKKTAVQPSRNKDSAGRYTATAKSAAANEPEQQRTFWRSEIEALAGRRFASLNEALASIADVVLDRLGARAEQRQQEKKFLTDLLGTDKQICDDVRSILRVS